MTWGSVVTVFNCFTDTYKFKGSFFDMNYMPHTERVLKCIIYMTNNQTYIEFSIEKQQFWTVPRKISI